MADDVKRSGVYVIRCKTSGRVYVGSAASTFANRWKGHRSDLRKNQHHSQKLQNAWNKYGEDNFEFKVAEYCPREYVLAQEQVYIDYYLQRGKGFLFNVCYVAGNCAGVKQSEITKRKRREGMLKHFENPEYRAAHKTKSAASVKKTYENPEHRERMSKMLSERHKDPLFKEKITQASLKVRKTPESQARLRAALKELHASPEHKAKMKAVREKNWSNPEFAEAHSRKLRERHADPAYKLKHGEAMKKRWKSPEEVQRQRERLAAQKADPVFKEKQREAMRKLWADPEFRARQAAKAEARRKLKQ